MSHQLRHPTPHEQPGIAPLHGAVRSAVKAPPQRGLGLRHLLYVLTRINLGLFAR